MCQDRQLPYHPYHDVEKKKMLCVLEKNQRGSSIRMPDFPYGERVARSHACHANDELLTNAHNLFADIYSLSSSEEC